MVFVWHCWTVQESTGVVLDHLAKYIHHPENRFTIHIKTNMSPTISPETDDFFNVFLHGSLVPSILAIPSLTGPSALSGKEKFFSSCARTLKSPTVGWWNFRSINGPKKKWMFYMVKYGQIIWSFQQLDYFDRFPLFQEECTDCTFLNLFVGATNATNDHIHIIIHKWSAIWVWIIASNIRSRERKGTNSVAAACLRPPSCWESQPDRICQGSTGGGATRTNSLGADIVSTHRDTHRARSRALGLRLS